MQMTRFQDTSRYDSWIKILLAFPIILLLGFTILFYVDAKSRDVLNSVGEAESFQGASIMMGTTVFILVVYWAVLPRDLFVLMDRIKIKFGLFSYSIPFYDIESVKIAEGIPWLVANSMVTSFKSQIEIKRKKGLKTRISPTRRDLFLDSLNRAISEWNR